VHKKKFTKIFGKKPAREHYPEFDAFVDRERALKSLAEAAEAYEKLLLCPNKCRLCSPKIPRFAKP